MLTSGEAAGKAQVLLYLAWLERTDVSFSLPGTYGALETAGRGQSGDAGRHDQPAPDRDLLHQRRTASNTGQAKCGRRHTDGVRRGWCRQRAGDHRSVGNASYQLLDVPLMLDAQADGCALLGMWRQDRLEGGALYASSDAGATWDRSARCRSSWRRWAMATNSIGSVEHRIRDAASVLSVTLTQGTLASISESALFSGSNHFAYGVDRR